MIKEERKKREKISTPEDRKISEGQERKLGRKKEKGEKR